MKNNQKPKVIVIVGPTATGKSDLAVQIAKEFNGEIISADSRQVYKGLDIGSGKITKSEMQNIPHHLLDVANPKETFTVSDYKILANKAIIDIIKKVHLPIIVGGTGFYIQTIVDNMSLPEVPPNLELREQLEEKPLQELREILIKIDPSRASVVDQNNRRRLIRAIEIAETIGKTPVIKPGEQKYSFLQIGIDVPKEELDQKIEFRLKNRLETGMIEEVDNLHQGGVSWGRLEELGLEYRYVSLFLQNKISYDEMFDQLFKEIKKYAKRQRTWFKRDKKIIWIKNKTEAFEIIKKGFRQN